MTMDDQLNSAAMNGRLDEVKFLIKNGANIHANENSALVGAASAGNLEIVKYLLDNGANIHVQGDNPLFWALYNGRLEVVKYLLNSGANINAHNGEYYAIYNRHHRVVEYCTKHKIFLKNYPIIKLLLLLPVSDLDVYPRLIKN
jgi:ankyrin repeat protein